MNSNINDSSNENQNNQEKNNFNSIFHNQIDDNSDDSQDIETNNLNNNNFEQQKYSWQDRFKPTEKEIKQRKLFSFGLSIFYILCLVFIVLGGLFWWNNHETFYLTANEVSMIMNDNYQIGMYGKTEQKRNDSYVYESSNTDIIEVDENGIIHSKTEGEATVTVKSKYSSKKNIIKVNVEGDSIFSVEFENDNITLDLEEKRTLKPIVNGNKDFKADIVWKSDNNRIATISSLGEIRGVTEVLKFLLD